MNEKAENVDFYDKLWLEEWQDMESSNPTARHLEVMIVRLLEKYGPTGSLIDVGCGMGVNLKRLHNHFPDMKLVGTDLSDSILGIAENYVGKSGNINYVSLDIAKEKVDETFDVVLCSQVLEHIEDDRAAIKNMAAMCNKYLLITVPAGKYNSTSKLVGHFRHYTPEDLAEKVTSLGFEIKFLREWGFPFHSVYKAMLGLLPPESQKNIGFGRYGLFKRTLSNILFYLFYGNIFNRGANVILMAEKRAKG